jgi:hypothetical protein
MHGNLSFITNSCMFTSVSSPGVCISHACGQEGAYLVIACVSLTSTHVTQLTDDCMDQLTRTRWQITSVSVSECLDLSRSLLWHISYSCSLYLL